MTIKNTLKNTPKDKTDFAWITAPSKEYMTMAKRAIGIKINAMIAVKAVPLDKITFENTVQAMEFADQQLSAIWGQLEFLMNSKPNASDRKFAKIAADFIRTKYIELDYDEDIYNVFAALEKKKPKLQGANKKLFTDTMLAYKRMGFALPKAKRNVVKKKVLKLADVASNFRKNINEYDDHILVTREELSGASENYIKGLKKQGSKYIVSLQYPDYIPFMENVSNDAKRKELHAKYLQKGGKKNMTVLAEMVKMRAELSKLLGYKNHAAYVLENKMAKNPETVFKFLNSLMRPMQKKVDADVAEMRAFKNGPVQSHDVLYLINQTKQQKFSIDDETVREYFPLETVTKGLFKIYEQLLGVKFKAAPKLPTWHKDARGYEVFDAATGKHLAYFYLDLFPRAGKYGHAAVFPIIPGLKLPTGEYQKPLVAMLCNFAPRLSHDEVNTYFHEFGHVVHGVLTTAKYGSQSGTSVQHDFAEAPSQMLENWVWDEPMLQLLSGHYKNPNKKLPKELLRNLLKAKYHMIGYFNMRQLVLGTFDMRLHTDKNVKNITKLYADLVKKYIKITLPKDQIFPAGFGHLDGYDANYYGYMWSLVYAADMFTRFEKQGLLNSKTGRDYRTNILAPGGSQDAMELITAFLKRKPNNKAFLKELGLI